MQLVVIPSPKAKAKLVGLELVDANKGRKRCALVLVHGAGLNFTAPLYVDVALLLAKDFDVYLPGLRASGFVDYSCGFRKPLGWAYHRSEEALLDYRSWIEWVSLLGYETIVLAGHSWGGLLTLSGATTHLRNSPLILLSPLPSTHDVIEVNYGLKPVGFGEFLERIAALDDHDLVPTRPGAPLAFLSVMTIKSLISPVWGLQPLLSSWEGKALIMLGGSEHQKLLTQVEDIAESLSSQATVVKIRNQGHFYTSGVVKLADEVKSWLVTLLKTDVFDSFTERS